MATQLAQVMHAIELVRQTNDNVKTFSVHPGVVNTNLFYRESTPLKSALMQPLVWMAYGANFVKTPASGCETAVYLSVDEAVCDEPLASANGLPSRVNDGRPGKHSSPFLG